MKNSKLARILFVLKSEELKQFESYLKSKIIEKTAPLWVFFLLIKKQLAQKEEAVWEKEFLFQKIFPKQSFQDGKMRRLMHELWLELEEFIIFQQKKKDFEKEIYLLDFYYEHYLTKEFQESLERLILELQNYSHPNLVYWKAVEKVELYKSYAIAMNYVYKDNMNLHKVLESQITVFFIQQLKYSFFLYANQFYSKEKYTPPFLHNILTEVKRNPLWLENELLSVYYYAVRMFLEEDFEAFVNLRKMVQVQTPILSFSDWAALAFGLRNFANYLKNKNSEFISICFELYLEHISMGFVFSNNHISPQAVVNVCNMGIELKEIAKVEKFLEESEQYFPPSIKENLSLLCHAYIAYSKSDYEEALKTLLIVEKFEHFTFELDVRTLKVKVFYEMKEMDLCIHQLNAFQVLTHRHKKMTQEQKVKYQTFCRIMLKCCQLNPNEATEKAQLLEQVKNTSPLPYKNWILSLLT
ncbi:MAG: hypothetical protein ACKVTZ_23425 [Bacteroidia bacterium]